MAWGILTLILVAAKVAGRCRPFPRMEQATGQIGGRWPRRSTCATCSRWLALQAWAPTAKAAKCPTRTEWASAALRRHLPRTRWERRRPSGSIRARNGSRTLDLRIGMAPALTGARVRTPGCKPMPSCTLWGVRTAAMGMTAAHMPVAVLREAVVQGTLSPLSADLTGVDELLVTSLKAIRRMMRWPWPRACTGRLATPGLCSSTTTCMDLLAIALPSRKRCTTS
mmetsp:Transcript_8800/g.25344  ORF Transcript_8800/g.25344 Transcript_8800/m.25344 type:complete len:225 (+) Transcript_8800:1707-2381(+)